MAIQVEFEWGERTYRVEPGLHEWNIYAILNLRKNIVLSTDLISNEKIFIDWSSISVMRLVEPA